MQLVGLQITDCELRGFIFFIVCLQRNRLLVALKRVLPRKVAVFLCLFVWHCVIVCLFVYHRLIKKRSFFFFVLLLVFVLTEGSVKQEKIKKTGCKIICGAPTTLAVKGLMTMMMMMMMMMMIKVLWIGLHSGRETPACISKQSEMSWRILFCSSESSRLPFAGYRVQTNGLRQLPVDLNSIGVRYLVIEFRPLFELFQNLRPNPINCWKLWFELLLSPCFCGWRIRREDCFVLVYLSGGKESKTLALV